jgi:hypothetical protein
MAVKHWTNRHKHSVGFAWGMHMPSIVTSQLPLSSNVTANSFLDRKMQHNATCMLHTPASAIATTWPVSAIATSCPISPQPRPAVLYPNCCPVGTVGAVSTSSLPGACLRLACCSRCCCGTDGCCHSLLVLLAEGLVCWPVCSLTSHRAVPADSRNDHDIED